MTAFGRGSLESAAGGGGQEIASNTCPHDLVDEWAISSAEAVQIALTLP
jgi:hypothetical protein